MSQEKSLHDKIVEAMMLGQSIAYSQPKREFDRESTYKELVDALGEDKVNRSTAVLAVYSKNMMSWRSAKRPDFVVQPETIEDIQATMRICNKYKCPVTVQGLGTGANVTIAFLGGVLLDTARMRRIIEINKDADFAVIEPGVTYMQLCTELHKHGYTYPHGTFPPMARVISNVLGMHGLHRPHLYPFNMLSAQIVLADGSLLVLGSDTIPDWTQNIAGSVVGADLLGLFRRSVGTLGIVARAAIRIFPELEEKRILVYGFDKYSNSVDFGNFLCRNWLMQDYLIFLWSWVMHKKHRVQVTNELPEDANKTYPLTKPPAGVPYNFANVLIEGVEEDVDNREKVIDKASKKFGGCRIPNEEVQAKWPWYWNHIETWWIKDLPIFLEPYVNVQGQTVPFYTIVQGSERAKKLEHFLVNDVLQKLEDEHPTWTTASGYLSWPCDNGRRWFIRCLSWFQDYTDDPEEHLKLRSEAERAISMKFRPELVENYYVQMGGLPLSMEIVTTSAAVEPTSAQVWLKIKRALDPNNILNPYVILGVEKMLEQQRQIQDQKAGPMQASHKMPPQTSPSVGKHPMEKPK
jgi:FAD/FMN-containing dehydrogenase